MGVDVKEVIAYLMENGEVERIRNSLDLSDMVDIELFERSSYAYKDSLPDLEFSNFYCKRYSYYIDGELDAVYSQYWWDGIMLSDSLLYGRTTTSLYVDSGITVDLDDWEQRVIDSCVFSILTDIHNYLY